MKTSVDQGRGRLALLAAHCAGMVDLAALPLWIGVLVADYHFGPQGAGALVSIFLLAAVVSSLFVSSRFARVRAAPVAFGCYALAATAFAASAATNHYGWLCGWYVVGGLAVGGGLSLTHGTIGQSRNPHRLIAIAGAAFGVFAICFFGLAPPLTARYGGAALFWLFAGVMTVAAMCCALWFPTRAVAVASAGPASRTPLGAAVWCAIAGVSCMALNQAITASFLQRIGLDRGFSASSVNAVLVALAIVTILPAPLAGMLQRRASTRAVVVIGPVAQIAVALVITQGTPFWAYAIAGSLLTSVQIFVHTFAFGWIARIDRSGRAVAATPAMLMTGSAIGPFLAGTLVGTSGYASLGYAVVAIGAVAIFCFHRSTLGANRVSPAPVDATGEPAPV